MTNTSLFKEEYSDTQGQVSWEGVGISDAEEFAVFMSKDVASRLNDTEAADAFETHMRGLANTGFANESLRQVLAATVPEDRDWAVGEALAEAYLSKEHSISWPWNNERDKRTPKASLPGADLVGFKNDGGNIHLVVGEVKTSGDEKSPPNVMYGRSGMAHQIDNLANNLSLMSTLLRWLLPRCKGTQYERMFNQAITAFLGSGNKAVLLVGILIRDTIPNESDLDTRGYLLSRTLTHPTVCELVAVYLPCQIANLREMANRGIR